LSREVTTGRGRIPIGRRERAKQDKRERIMTAARELPGPALTQTAAFHTHAAPAG